MELYDLFTTIGLETCIEELDSGDYFLQLSIAENGCLAFEFVESQGGSGGAQGPQGEDGPQGIQGEPGPAGAQGPQGDPGADGNDGADGANGSVWYASGTPPVGENDGDYWLDTTTGDIYQSQVPMGWVFLFNIQGPQGIPGNDGADGLQGPQGDPGPQGIPGNDGADGAVGPQGPQGVPGNDGADGIDGSTWFVDAGVPDNGNGVDGDFYLNETNGDVYVKVAGVWSLSTNITGPQGIQGIQGVQGVAGNDGADGMLPCNLVQDDFPDELMLIEFFETPGNPGCYVGGANVNYGTYTPTLTNVANLDASLAFEHSWLRVGNVVHVGGRVEINPTNPTAVTQLGISLPYASDIQGLEGVTGSAACPGIISQSAAILGDAVNNRAQMEWISGDTTAQSMYYTFQYYIV